MLRRLSFKKPVRLLASACRTSFREYNFGSTKYATAFEGLPTPDDPAMRRAAVEYVSAFDPKLWYDVPICTILNGKRVEDGQMRKSVDAFEKENGNHIISPPEIVDKIIDHLKTYKPDKVDFRKEARAIEADLLKNHVGFLIGNQALDFHKQDGITECSEWEQACLVEQRLGDQLLADEQAGVLEIRRDCAFIGCVSNFSNFLDLSRKCLRNLELGVPICVLSRSNTSQHMFRWCELLVDLCKKHGIPDGMVTYLSAPLAEKKRVLNAVSHHPLYLTGSRETAADIKKIIPALMASTGGPNTMVAQEPTAKILEAARLSTLIENSGQCTAMRHLVTGKTASTEEVESQIFPKEKVEIIPGPLTALTDGTFAAITEKSTFELEKGYTKHKDLNVAIRVNDQGLPDEMDEMWRYVYLDVTPNMDMSNGSQDIDKLAKWLNTHQPISLVVNGKEPPYQLFKRLFDSTALVVYSMGSDDYPALTAQAKPQEAEVFGEFPPRHELQTYTKYPMVVPTPGPAYNSAYTKEFLLKSAKAKFPRASFDKYANLFTCDQHRGFAQICASYISDATAVNPKRGGTNLETSRTILYGLQAPPINTVSVIRSTSIDAILIRLLPYLTTNAKESITVSSTNSEVVSALQGVGFQKARLETDAEFNKWVSDNKPWNIMQPDHDTEEFPLMGQFVSLLFPLGHVKTTKPQDEEFVRVMNSARKWLRIEG